MLLLHAHVANLFHQVTAYNQALDYHLERHNLLASNIAHVDTPRFKPKDLARINEDDFQSVMNVTMQRTNAAHMADGAGEPFTGMVFQDLTAGGGADGNFVSLDREAGKLAVNRLRYDIVSVLVRSHLDGLMKAVNDRKSG
ncbi:MAG: flagellar basal body rod protein FlgB [Polyangiaceae bacterium]